LGFSPSIVVYDAASKIEASILSTVAMRDNGVMHAGDGQPVPSG
jgi:hypothetical protein